MRLPIRALVVAAIGVAACERNADIAARGNYAPVADALGPFVEWQMETKRLPALSIALVDDQEIVWARGFGFQSPGDSVPASAATVYRVGSVSKLFSDIAVMQLVERGALDLDVPIDTYLADFRPASSWGKAITLRQLMSHRAGLVREPPVGNYFDDTEPSLAATVASVNDTRLVYEPETRVKYSNAGIAVVGYLLEVTQGVPFAEHVRRAVLEPLGMTRSAFAPQPDLEQDMAHAVMWAFDGREYPAPTFQLGMAPAGSMYSTVLDLGRFMSAAFAGGTWNGQRVIDSTTLEDMWTPQFAEPGVRFGYGLGFSIGQLDGHRRIGHGGAIYGFATELAMLPEEKLGVVVTTSRDVANAVTDLIADVALRAVLAMRNGEEIVLPPLTEPLPRDRVRQLIGRYLLGDHGLDLYDWGDRLVGLLVRGGSPFELRARNDTLFVDGVTDQGGWVYPLEGGRLIVGRDTIARAVDTAPGEAPARWRGLIGEYGWDHNTLFVFEKDQRLHALIEWIFDYPLEEASPDVFAFPDFGLYHGERLVFHRDASGRATDVTAASVRFARRNIEPGAGEPFRIVPRSPIEALRRDALAATPPATQAGQRAHDLVELVTLDSTIRLDIRYATTNNFMGSVFYDVPRAFLQRPAAEAVVRAHHALGRLGLGILVHDAYRPWYVTKMFWDATPDSQRLFVANPANGSRHNRGTAIDLTLYDLRSGRAVDMVGSYDEFTARSYPYYLGGTARQRWYRDLLRRVMEDHGFRVYEFEWWHFDHEDWAQYPILNLRLSDIR